MWTISGIYFSWTDIDEIHGDQFLNQSTEPSAFTNLVSPSDLNAVGNIHDLELRDIAGEPHYWVNHNLLFHARTGKQKEKITEEEAYGIAKKIMSPELEAQGINLITETDRHHEIRGQSLPVYEISYKNNGNLKAYISSTDGSFKSVRFRDWRWFDFLWMTHTMDYEGRDNFNNIILRSFSLLGLITVLSGFLLWYISSQGLKKFWSKKRNRF